MNIFPPFAVDKNHLYISENKDDSYRINVYKNNGELEYIIKKKYRKIPLTDEENRSMVEQTKFISGDEPISKIRNKYKKAVNYIIPEKNGKIWVLTSVERDNKNKNLVFIDIFDNGKISKQYKVNGLSVQDFNYDNLSFKIANGKLYQFDAKKGFLTVFEIL